MADVQGPWDHATWIPGGALTITKGDIAAHIDVSAASGKEDDAVAIAKQIVPRFDHPLDYDGAKAVASAPKPKAHPDQACDLVPKSAVEAAIGPLDGDPTPGADATECDYKVASAQGPRTYKVEYVWQGGQKNYNMLKHGMSTLGSVMGGAIPTAGMDNMKMDSNTSKMIGGLMKMAGGGGPGAWRGDAGGLQDGHDAQGSVGQRDAAARHAAARGEERCDGRDGSADGRLREGEGADGRDLLEVVMRGAS